MVATKVAKNKTKQESPPAWTQEAYRPQRIKCSICCLMGGGVPHPRYPHPDLPGGGGYPILGIPPSDLAGGTPTLAGDTYLRYPHPDLAGGTYPRYTPILTWSRGYSIAGWNEDFAKIFYDTLKLGFHWWEAYRNWEAVLLTNMRGLKPRWWKWYVCARRPFLSFSMHFQAKITEQ